MKIIDLHKIGSNEKVRIRALEIKEIMPQKKGSSVRYINENGIEKIVNVYEVKERIEKYLRE